eukprot:7823942-Ditylum_brightwellii.AAC.1
MALNDEEIRLNQCSGDCLRPYSVLSSFQYVPCFDTGQPDGGLTMTTSSSGRTPWQNALQQSVCLSTRLCETAMETRSRTC